MVPLILGAVGPAIHGEAKIKVNNAILAKVHDKTISVLDVMKRMDFLFYKAYPQYADSLPARYQFYNVHWKMILNEMINTELMLADATAKKVPLTDGEVREEVESRFGPNVVTTLGKMGLSYDEAWNMVKTEMITMRMNWYFVHSKAMQQVTPQMVKDAYTSYLKDHAEEELWKYHIISISTGKQEEAQKIYELINNQPIDEIEKMVTAIPIKVSKIYEISGKNLSDAHKEVLSKMKKNSFSSPVIQTSKYSTQPVCRIFYLVDYKKTKAASFDAMADQLKGDLLQKAAVGESKKYIDKLKRFYGIDEKELSSDFTPFVLE
jgi:hypothetical protein